MKVLVETPRYSFRKYRKTGGGFKVDLTSPLPTLFNYGIVGGTKGADGLPHDVVVLGRRVRQATVLEVEKVGLVKFIDDGLMDDKIVASEDGRISRIDVFKIKLFFLAYSVFKKIRGLVKTGKIPKTSFGGFIPVR
ncbi:MAG TPA: inorganic pyrophosphatase [Candidatus Altiarchaeales archaeon]|nr:inorganic pyrophosphatase [Candidatus Altiarchaeales archaeon]